MATQAVDAVYMSTSPTQTSQISGGAAQLGIVPLTFMAAPAYNEAFVAEGSPIAALFTSGAHSIQQLGLIHMRQIHQVTQLCVQLGLML